MGIHLDKSLALAIAIAIFCPFAAYADAQSARVLAVRAGVDSIFQGKTQMLAVKMDVPIQATVKSDNTGRAQLMLPDDSTVSVAPDTEISLVEFVDTPEEENIVINLATGTARFITGEASRRNPAAFTVNTPQASISIRGTMVTIQVIGDATKIYLNETSGKGVTVKNKNTGKEIRMRKPGMLITVEPEKMYERRAEEGEARDFNLALRGKFRPAALARAKAGGNLVRTADMSLAASGNLPVTTALNLSQMDQMNHTAQVANATLVSATSRPVNPDIPGQVPSAPTVPSRPTDTPSQMPVTPIVPVTPAQPTTPNTPPTPSQPAETPPVPDVPDSPSVPDTPAVNPVVPPVIEPPVENYTFTYAELAGTYVGNGEFNFYNNIAAYYNDTPALSSERTITITVPEQYYSVVNANEFPNPEGWGPGWKVEYQVTAPAFINGQITDVNLRTNLNDINQLNLPSVLLRDGYGAVIVSANGLNEAGAKAFLSIELNPANPYLYGNEHDFEQAIFTGWQGSSDEGVASPPSAIPLVKQP